MSTAVRRPMTGRIPAPASSGRGRLAVPSGAWAYIGGGLAAVLVGGVVATGNLKVLSLVIGLCAIFALAALYRANAAAALRLTWVYFAFTIPASGVVGYNSALGVSLRQSDDVLALVLLTFTIIALLARPNTWGALRFVVAGLGVAVLGILSAAVAQEPLLVTVQGAWLGLKLWTFLLITLVIPWSRAEVQRTIDLIITVGVGIALLGIADFLSKGRVAQLFGVNVSHTGLSYRADAAQGVFPNPGEFSFFASMFFAIAISQWHSTRSRAKQLAVICLFLLAVVVAFRLKGAISIAAVLVISTLFAGRVKSRTRHGMLILAAVMLAVLCVAESGVLQKQVDLYANPAAQGNTRARLYEVGGEIAAKDFPLGVGFGRFASFTSSQHYSSVYDEYDLSHIWGLSRAEPKFISDTSWPSVLGETGLFGLMAYGLGILAIGSYLWRYGHRLESPRDRAVVEAALLSLVVIIVDSTGSPVLFSWLGVSTLALTLGPALRFCAKQKSLDSPAPRRIGWR